MRVSALFVNVLIVATCGLVYELLAGTLASYVLGDTVTQFSLIIGLYLSAMGLGAYFSKFINEHLAYRFLDVELAVALVGGLSAPLLFLSFGRSDHFYWFLYGIVLTVGTLVGLELPILMRILRDHLDFKDLVSRVLTFDYLGALVASLLFPLFFLPRLGLVRTSLVMGIANAGVALWGTWLLAPLLKDRQRVGVQLRAVIIIAVLVVGVVQADRLTSLAEDELFADPVVYTETTAYQRIVVTEGTAGHDLFLDGNLQFSSADEYRYHEAPVHPAMSLASERGPVRHVLVLGGGDGLAVREVLRWEDVSDVTLVDIDPAMTTLARRFPPLRALNHASLEDPRVTVINADAMLWLEHRTSRRWDVAIVDFPDPNTFALGKLYTSRFYKILASRLAPQAAIAVQSTSPLFARKSFWCVMRTMEDAGFAVRPYQLAVPSFGVWGFALASAEAFSVPTLVPSGLRYLNTEAMAAMFALPADVLPEEVEVNRLDNQVLVRLYDQEWRRWE